MKEKLQQASNVYTTTENEKYTMYGGQRGGGKIFFLENMVAFLKAELEEVKLDRDRWKSAALYYAEKCAAMSKEV